jgi:hypothetical protein
MDAIILDRIQQLLPVPLLLLHEMTKGGLHWALNGSVLADAERQADDNRSFEDNGAGAPSLPGHIIDMRT